VADRARAFNIRCETVDGNDPVQSYLELKKAFAYVRKERKPFLVEAMVSRLYGHSSASGANFVPGEVDCLTRFEERLAGEGVLARERMDAVHKRWTDEIAEMARRVREEPLPEPESVFRHVYWQGGKR